MIRIFLSLVFLGTFCIIVEGQHFYSIDLPERLEDHPVYQQLLTQRAHQLQLADLELEHGKRAGLSTNVLFYLELAIEKIGATQEAVIASDLAKLNAHRPLTGVDTSALIAVEKALIRINDELTHLNSVYRFSGASMTHYPVDTFRNEISEELAFYQLPKGTRVAEIGAGNGSFAAAVAVAKPGITLYINEISPRQLDHIAYHLQYNPVYEQAGSHFYPILGDHHSIGLEGIPLHAVLIRNAIHHFDVPSAMLPALYSSLYPNGKLYLKERFREACKANCCDRLLNRDHLMELLHAAGFELTAEKDISGADGPWMLLEFGIASEKEK